MQRDQNEFAELLDWQCQNACLSPVSKMSFLSQWFLGRPYLNGALGEGVDSEFDQSPSLRADCFDCVTYVNTLLAILHSTNLIQLNFHMVRLNYKNSKVSYQNRHHFLSSDWNTSNAHLGYIRDFSSNVVDSIGKSICETAHAFIDKPSWILKRGLDDIKLRDVCSDKVFEEKLKSLHALARDIKAVHAYIAYIPFTRLFNLNEVANPFILAQLPDMAIVEIVRPNWDLRSVIGTHINVSHLGLLLRIEDKLVFRHASQVSNQVIEEPLVDYLQQYLHSSTIKGINVQEILA